MEKLQGCPTPAAFPGPVLDTYTVREFSFSGEAHCHRSKVGAKGTAYRDGPCSGAWGELPTRVQWAGVRAPLGN